MVFPQTVNPFTMASWKLENRMRHTDVTASISLFYKHLSKILELRNSLNFFSCPCRMTCTHCYITQGHRINMFGIVHICAMPPPCPYPMKATFTFSFAPKTLPGIKLKTELAAAALVNFLRDIFLVIRV